MYIHRQIRTIVTLRVLAIWCHQQRFVVKRPTAIPGYSLMNQTTFPRGGAYRLEIMIAPIDKRHALLSLLSQQNFYKATDFMLHC